MSSRRSINWLGAAPLAAMLLAAIVWWDALVQDPVLLVGFALLELIMLAAMHFRGILRNEFAVLFLVMSLVYSHSFVFEALIGLTEPETFAIVINLSALGLELIEDSAAMFLASMLLRMAVLLGWWGRIGEPLKIGEALASIRVGDVILVGLLSFASFILALATKISIIVLLAGNLFISFVAIFWIVVARRFGFRLVPLMLVIAVAAGLLLALGRSRLPIMVVSLSLLTIYLSRGKVTLWQQVTIGLSVLVIFLMFGFLRESVGDRGDREGAGVLSLEETGNMHLIGAHIVGLASRGDLPPTLDESILDKVLRAVPGSGMEMLADRYIWAFFPELAAGGGGFAYPFVGEWFSAGGVLGVVAVGLIFGGLMAVLGRRVRSSYAVTILLVFFGQLLRQELSASMLTLITLLAGSVMLQVLRQIVVLCSEGDVPRRTGAAIDE